MDKSIANGPPVSCRLR